MTLPRELMDLLDDVEILCVIDTPPRILSVDNKQQSHGSDNVFNGEAAIYDACVGALGGEQSSEENVLP